MDANVCEKFNEEYDIYGVSKYLLKKISLIFTKRGKKTASKRKNNYFIVGKTGKCHLTKYLKLPPPGHPGWFSQ